jgi:hypothetical protein
MRGWRYDQVLTSEAFGLPLARDVTTQELMESVQRAYRPGRPKTKSSEYKKAMARLRAHSITAAENEQEKEMRESLVQELRKLNTSMKHKKVAH